MGFWIWEFGEENPSLTPNPQLPNPNPQFAVSSVLPIVSTNRYAERVRLHPRFATLLEAHGLTDAESLFATKRGVALRRLAARENWRLELADGQEGTTTLYLKKHCERSWSTRLRRWLGLPLPTTPARREAERTAELAHLGIPTMTVAAFAERLRPDGTLIGAFLTEELVGFQQLDLFLTARFARRDDPKLRELLRGCAELAGRFHGAGFNHRDFYTCHFFIRENNPAEFHAFAIHLIDLQRVQHWPRGLRRRWVVKDLAQLAYSTPRTLIGPAERMRFFKAYLQIARLDGPARRLARAICRRESALRRKHGSYRPEWEQVSFSVVHSPSQLPEAA